MEECPEQVHGVILWSSSWNDHGQSLCSSFKDIFFKEMQVSISDNIRTIDTAIHANVMQQSWNVKDRDQSHATHMNMSKCCLAKKFFSNFLRSRKRGKPGYLFILDKCFESGRPCLAAFKISFSKQKTVLRSNKNSFSGHLKLLHMPCASC